jgi:hypothetical protein
MSASFTSARTARWPIALVVCALAVSGLAVTALASAEHTAAEAHTTAGTLTVGEPTTLLVTPPASQRAAGSLTYDISVVHGVTLLGGATGALAWDPQAPRATQLPIRLTVSRTVTPGRLRAAVVTFRWPDGHVEAVDLWVVARAAPGTSSVLDMTAQVTAIPSAVPPGGSVKLRFTIVSNEEAGHRLRLRVGAAAGWQLGPDDEEREWVVDAFSRLTDEVDMMVPEDATPGERQLVRLLVQAVGDPGVVEAQAYVAVVGSGNQVGGGSLSGSWSAGVSRLSGGGDAFAVGGLEMASSFGNGGALTFSFDRGLESELSNYRYTDEPAFVEGSLKYAGWDVTVGTRLFSPGTAVSGPSVQGVGGALRHRTGRLVADLLVARPTLFEGDAAGHMVRGRTGIRTRRLVLAGAFSDFTRPEGGYTTLPRAQDVPLDPDEEDQLEIERQFGAGAPSNRVHGAGLELEVRPNRLHRFTARAGHIWLANAVDTRVSGASGEAAYVFSMPQKATFTARWRQMPATVPGIYILGDELVADGTVRLSGPFSLVGRAYQNASETAGRTLKASSEGGSFGFRLQGGGRRFEVRGHVRESEFVRRTVRRTVAVTAGLPLGPFTATANVDLGQQDNGLRVAPIAFYRGDVRWFGDAGSISLSATRSETWGVIRDRADVIASWNVRRWELAGGAWATRGYIVGGDPGMWVRVGAPVARDLLLTLGMDHAPPEWGAAPTWRGMIGLRKRFGVATPFGGPAVLGTLLPDAHGMPLPVAPALFTPGEMIRPRAVRTAYSNAAAAPALASRRGTRLGVAAPTRRGHLPPPATLSLAMPFLDALVSLAPSVASGLAEPAVLSWMNPLPVTSAVDGLAFQSPGLDRPSSWWRELDACTDDAGSVGRHVRAAAARLPVFDSPRSGRVPFRTLARGTRVYVVEARGDWLLVQFDDQLWGTGFGYVSCGEVRVED